MLTPQARRTVPHMTFTLLSNPEIYCWIQNYFTPTRISTLVSKSTEKALLATVVEEPQTWKLSCYSALSTTLCFQGRHPRENSSKVDYSLVLSWPLCWHLLHEFMWVSFTCYGVLPQSKVMALSWSGNISVHISVHVNILDVCEQMICCCAKTWHFLALGLWL